jgi:hypothetical protein
MYLQKRMVKGAPKMMMKGDPFLRKTAIQQV